MQLDDARGFLWLQNIVFTSLCHITIYTLFNKLTKGLSGPPLLKHHFEGTPDLSVWILQCQVTLCSGLEV